MSFIKDIICSDLSVIKTGSTRNNAIMSLDVSKKHIGIAVSDTNLLMAFEYINVVRTKLIEDIKIINKVIKEKNIFAIVVGLPLNNEGEHNERTQSIYSFINSIYKELSLPIFVQDERFSTYFANHNLNNNKHLNNANKRKNLDSYASAWFLQNFLDKFKNWELSHNT